MILPKEVHRKNFLSEMIKWPSKWRNYWATMHPAQARRAAQVTDGSNWCSKILEKWEPSEDMHQSLEDCIALKGSLRNGKISEAFRNEFSRKYLL